MRVALLILLGLAIGVLGTVNVMNTLRARNPMPEAVMTTMDYHMGQLRSAIKAGQCSAPVIAHHLQRVHSTASDIEPVFGIKEKTFIDDAAQLRDRTQAALAAAPATCAALGAAIKPIGETCKSCHQQYR
ncbi:MAG: cytochrome c [Rhodanobacter sp.]